MDAKNPITDTLLDKRLEAEHALIGCAMIRGDNLRQECGWLMPECFHDERAGAVWKAFLAGNDPVNIAFEIGGDAPSTVIGWMQGVYNSYTQGGELARSIARLAHLAANRDDLNWLAKAIADGDYDDATALIRKMADRTPAASVEVDSAVEVGESFLVAMDGENYTIDTRMVGLDRATGGLERQNLTVIAAPPSTGKSAIALQIARNVADSGRTVLFASLEMPKNDLWARMACGDAGVTWLDVRRKLPTFDQLAHVRDTTLQLMERYGARLLIHDQPSSTADLW